MTLYQRLVLSLLCCILRRLIEGDKPFRQEYEAMLLANADAELDKSTLKTIAAKAKEKP